MNFVEPLLRRCDVSPVIRNQRNGHVLADRVLPALDSRSRRTGLLRHKSLPQGHAMVIAPTSAIHTFFMHFPIDVAFVTRAGRVVKIRAAVRPGRVVLALRSYAVIELPAGTLSRCETLMGDTLVMDVAAEV